MDPINELAAEIAAYFNIELTESNRKRMKYYCEKFLKKYGPAECQPIPVPRFIKSTPLRIIARKISKKWGLTIEEMKRKTRKREVVNCRHEFSLVAKDAGYSCTAIGKFLETKDHTSIIHYWHHRKKSLLESA